MDLEQAKYYIKETLKEDGIAFTNLSQSVFAAICDGIGLEAQEVEPLYFEMFQEEVAELVHNDFCAFVKMAWSWVESDELVWGPHIEAVCRHLQATFEGKIKRLVINIPPRCSKSLISSVMFPMWVWLTRPEHKFMCASLTRDLAHGFSRKSRDIATRPEYQRLCSKPFELRDDEQSIGKFSNSSGGYRQALSVDGKVTGFGADTIIVDDPLDALGSLSEAVLEHALKWFTGALPTRLNQRSKGVIVLVMQRIHELDPAGWAIKKGWTALVLPMRFEPENKCKTRIGFEDWRTEPGELLESNRFPEWAVEEMAQSIADIMGMGAVYAQLQQRPTSQEGNIFKREWFKRYRVLPATFDEIAMSADLTFGGKEKHNSFVVIQVWGRIQSQYYLLDQFRARVDFPTTIKEYIKMCRKWPMAKAKYVEKKANGQALIDSLSEYIPGIIAVEPMGSKEARAHSVVPLFEAKNIWVPHDEDEPWVRDFVEEFCSFPKGANDDQVDTASQALSKMWLSRNQFTVWTSTQLDNALSLFR